MDILKWIGIGVGGLAVLFTGYLFVLSRISKNRPDDLGLVDGKLRACPGSPNCVTSHKGKPSQKTGPLSYSGSRERARKNLVELMAGMRRTAVVVEHADYVHVEFITGLMGFVDDVEFFLPEGEAVIHLRSASRMGTFDFGANRRRVDAIHKAWTASQGKAGEAGK